MLVSWKGNMAFEAKTEAGHKIIMDAAPEVGGDDLGARPMELILAGLGGCSSIDVVMMLQKTGQNIKDCKVEIHAERADTVPKIYTNIQVNFKIYGKDLSENKVARAVKLSAEKYCSVSKMLEKAVDIKYSYTIIESC